MAQIVRNEDPTYGPGTQQNRWFAPAPLLSASGIYRGASDPTQARPRVLGTSGKPLSPRALFFGRCPVSGIHPIRPICPPPSDGRYVLELIVHRSIPARPIDCHHVTVSCLRLSIHPPRHLPPASLPVPMCLLLKYPLLCSRANIYI